MCIITCLKSPTIYNFLLVQTYEKVATAFKLDEDVVIANLDADKYKDLGEKLVIQHLFIISERTILS